MKFLRCIKFPLLFLALFSNKVHGQKTAWAHFQNGPYLNSQFTSSTSSWGATSPRIKNPRTGQFFTSYLGINAQYDKEGKLLFTVISTVDETFLFDRDNKWVQAPTDSEIKSGTILGYPYNLCSPEISIIPYKVGVLYHILTAGTIWEYDLSTNSINSRNANSYNYGSYNIGGVSGKTIWTSMQAVRQYDSLCEPRYYIYSVVANKPGSSFRGVRVTEVKEDKMGTSNTNFITTPIQDKDISSLFSGTYTTAFDYKQTEMEISEDGSMLAVIESNHILVYEINTTNHKVGELLKIFEYNPPTNTYAIGGVEFANNGTIVFSRYDSYNASWGNRGVYTWDISGSSNPVKIASSESWSKSNIEKSKNGKVYIPKNDGIYSINISSATINAENTGVTLLRRTDIYKHFFNTATTSDDAIYYLPDQLDGQNQELLTLSETVFTYNFGTSTTGSFNWNNASHGFTSKGNGKVFVINAINVPSSASPITLDGMVIEFYSNAEFNINPGGNVTLKGTVLKSHICGNMWRGVELKKGTGRLAKTSNNFYMMMNSIGVNSRIYDAYIGVKLSSPYSRLEATQGSFFGANEKHLYIRDNSYARIKLEYCFFAGELALKDQERGSNNGYSDNKRRTITGIEVYNGNLKIGNVNSNQNRFSGGQKGIYSVGSSIELEKAEMYGQKEYGVEFSANKQTDKNIKVIECNIHDLFRGVRIGLHTKSAIIQKNTFSNTSGYAIEYVTNPDGKLIIGDGAISSLGNTFNNCNWAAISCFDNSKYYEINRIPFGTSIQIMNNSINNNLYATGLYIGEPVVPADRNIHELNIELNAVGNTSRIGQPIVLDQVFGGNNKSEGTDRSLPTWKTGPNNYNTRTRIYLNNINYSNQINSGYSGILGRNAKGIGIVSNQISCNTVGDWRPYGIRLAEGNSININDNKVTYGNGLQVTGYGMYSNYYCNTFESYVVGIQLGWNYLRNSSNLSTTSHDDDKIHAVKVNSKIYGRPNVFANTISWSTDFSVYNKSSRMNQWDFINSNVPNIAYLDPKEPSIVHNINRDNPCGQSSPPDEDSVVDNSSSNIDYSGIQDPVQLWKLKYSIIGSYLAGETEQIIDDSSIVKLRQIEIKIEEQNYQAAKTLLNSYNPVFSVENDFKTVYALWVENKLQGHWDTTGLYNISIDTFWIDQENFILDSTVIDSQRIVFHESTLSDSAVQLLTVIAAKDGVTTSPAAYPARSILFAQRQLEFFDAPLPIYPSIQGIVNCNDTLTTSYRVEVYNELDSFTGIIETTQTNGKFYIDGYRLNELDTNLQYYLKILISDTSYIASNIASINDLAYGTPHIYDCSNSSPYLTHAMYENDNLMIQAVPNPSSEALYLQYMPQAWHLQIMDNTGKVWYGSEGRSDTQLNIGSLKSGMYIIVVEDSHTGKTQSLRIAKI